MSFIYTIAEWQYCIGIWAEKTFPDSNQETIIAHLRDEVNNEIGVDCDPEELADCVMLLLHLAHKRGIKLQRELDKKFEINHKRTWETEKNEKGFFGHVEDTL